MRRDDTDQGQRGLGAARGAPLRGLLALGLLAGAAAAGDLFPGPALQVPAGQTPRELVAGDVDNDGAADVVAADTAAGALLVLPSNGHGLGAPIASPTAPRPGHHALGDLDGDGVLDVVTAHAALIGRVSAGLADGAGGFAMAQTLVGGPEARRVALGDLDGDGALDLAVLATPTQVLGLGGKLRVHLGDGAGAFGPAQSQAVGSHGRDLALHDLDLDGLADVLLLREHGVAQPFGAPQQALAGQLEVRRGDGTGAFAPWQALTAGPHSRRLVVGDVTGDGLADVVVSQHHWSRVKVFAGSAGGALAGLGTSATPGDVTALTLGDVDLDGLPDVVAGLGGHPASTPRAAVLLGLPGALPALQEAPEVEQPLRSVCLLDVDQDGDLDLAGAWPHDGTVTLLENVLVD